MKKLLCFLLVLVIIPTAFVFTACKKDDGYQLSNLQTDLLKIDEKYDSVIIENNRLIFDYSAYKVNNVPVFQNCVNNVKPYTNVALYNRLYNNLMQFTFDYAGVCSNNNFDIDAGYRNNIKAKIDELDTSLEIVDLSVESLAGMLKNTDVTHTIYLSRLENLLKSYNRLFTAASDLSNAISDLYFNKMLYDSNPNVSEVSLAEFNASTVISSLDAKRKNALSLLTQNFIEIYVSNKGLTTELVSKVGDNFIELNMKKYNYSIFEAELKLVDLSSPAAVETAVEIANNELNKANFYEKAIQLYNIQEMIQNDMPAYIKACEDINYQQVKEDEEPSAYEQICTRIIENYFYITNQYSATLGELLKIINY